MTIRARIVVTLALSGLLLFGAYSIRTYIKERRELERVAERELHLLTRSLRVALENALRDRQLADVDESVVRLADLEPSVTVIVYDPTGSRIVTATAGAARDPGTDRVLADALRLGREVARFEDEGRRLILATPLLDDPGTPIGAMSVARTLDDLRADLGATRRDMIATVAIFVLVAGGLGMLIGTVYVRWPLARVRAGMRLVRAGARPADVRPRARDEIGDLVDEFNAMAHALADAQQRAAEASEARRVLERDLQRIDKMVTVGQLAAGLAHEIGSPLQVLLGRARALEATAAGEDTRRSAASMVAQAERITRVVEQLLSYAARRHPRRERIRLELPVRTILDLIAGEAVRRGVTVDLAVDAADTTIDADPDQVQQIVLNLVSNALAASPRGGRVTVRIADAELDPGAGRAAPALRLAVEDRGRGLPDEVRGRLFEPFFTTRAAEGGTGLGLAVVRAIAVEHGGTAAAIPLEVGARFEVTLPRAAPRAGGARA